MNDKAWALRWAALLLMLGLATVLLGTAAGSQGWQAWWWVVADDVTRQIVLDIRLPRSLGAWLGGGLLGLAGAVELASIPGTPGKRAYDIFMDCFHKGVWVRPAGENIVICPPYIVEDAHIDQIVQTVADSIRRHA